jgi:RNAse (barnase) inhibitor barstar
VYRAVRAAEVRRLTPAQAAGLDIVSISLSDVADKNALLERFGAALAFPDWFGGNWDALEDCLGDLSWRANPAHLLVIEGFEPLQAAARDDFGVLLDLLADVADHWSAQGRAFFAVFVDPGRRLGLRTWGQDSA